MADDAAIRVLLFDVGGVLVEIGGVPEFLRRVDPTLPIDEFWRRWLLSPTVRAFETAQLTPREFADSLLAEFGWHDDPEAFLQAFAAWPTRVFPGVEELLQNIPRRYQRVLLSNSNVLHWQRILQDMRLGQRVDRAFASHLTGTIKPDAAAFDYVLDALGCRAGQVAFFDDNPLNISAASALGLRSYLTRGSGSLRQWLLQLGVLSS